MYVKPVHWLVAIDVRPERTIYNAELYLSRQCMTLLSPQGPWRIPNVGPDNDIVWFWRAAYTESERQGLFSSIKIRLYAYALWRIPKGCACRSKFLLISYTMIYIIHFNNGSQNCKTTSLGKKQHFIWLMEPWIPCIVVLMCGNSIF